MNKDYGIEYNSGFPNPFSGFIEFCGIGRKNRFVFLEKMLNGITKTIYVDGAGISKRKNLINDIYAISELSDGTMCYFCMNPLRIIIEDDKHCDEIFLPEREIKYYPISINTFDKQIILTLYPARMIVLSKSDYKMKWDLDLTVIKMKYPLYVEPYSENTFLITDSKNNMIHIIDTDLNIIWEYGKRDEHGIGEGLLFAPQRATSMQDEKILVSLRRGHCVLVINKEKHVEKIWGTPFSIGGNGSSLWLPQALYIENELFVVMCEGAHISILKLNKRTEKWESFYSCSPINKSYLCQPRSCDYSFDYNMLLISDTEHDRIVGYDLDGIQKLLIDDTIIPNLNSPRCCIFHKSNLFITSSRMRSIYYTSISGKLFDYYIFDKSVASGQWLQSIEYLNDKLLVAFEKEVILLDWKTKQLIWSSSECNLLLDDVHYAQYVDEDCYLISDNGNNRLIFINKEELHYINEVKSDGEIIKLSSPRFAKIMDDNLYIVNTQTIQTQILVCDPDTLNLTAVFGGIKGLGDNRYSMPRWICKGPNRTVFISDTGNHRVVLRNI